MARPSVLVAAILVASATFVDCGGPPETDESARSPAPSGELDAPDDTPGRWRRARIDSSDPSLTAEQRAEIERLQSIGYVAGSRKAESSGVTLHVLEKTYEGLNLSLHCDSPRLNQRLPG